MENNFEKKDDFSIKGEEQIKRHMRDIDYIIREYPIEVLVPKYLVGAEDGKNDIFVPDYQRDFVWSEEQQSRFIESVIIGLPIPYLFVADISSDDEDIAGRLEIVDGTQRIRTLSAYFTNELKLSNLEKLTFLNGTYFSDLLPSRRRRFGRTTIRLIELTEKADEETRRDMFDRINSGGEPLNPMETRYGVLKGEFLKFIRRLASSEHLRLLAPLSAASIKRRDYDELLCRYFAYSDNYELFQKSVIDFVDQYVRSKSDFIESIDGPRLEAEWNKMLSFVSNNFSCGFRKDPQKRTTPRVRFEAIAVGVTLALREKPDLIVIPEKIDTWAYGEEFDKLVTSDGANSRPRLIKRINYVKEKVLKSC
ncbi:DUF262 domain-containing protein [Acetobacter sp. AAB5]|uniref:DUF262 domain-containing protein n=1 Tax=Acetobacter sp. AAB5 TaxID=3418370 RepID=UPI003CF6A9A2